MRNSPPPTYNEIMQPITNENPPSYYDTVFNECLDHSTVVNTLKNLCQNEMTKAKKRKNEITLGAMFGISKEDIMKLERRSEVLFVDYIKRTMERWNVSRIGYLVTAMGYDPNSSADPIEETFSFETTWMINDETTYETLMTILNDSRIANGETHTK